ncbi:MAG: BatA domain-containing protein [Bacteroidota bacterium]
MVFEHPSYLFGLFLLIVPILIHFLNFHRTRTVYFSSLKLLREVQSTHRNRRNIQDLLLLLIRLLIIACLVLAFAKPVRTNDSERVVSGGMVGLYLDDSYSMEINGTGETLLRQAKKQAGGIIRSYPPDTRFFLITNGTNREFQGVADPEMALERIAALEPASSTTAVAEIMKQFSEGPGDDRNYSAIYLISDFTANSFDSPLDIDSTGTPVYTVPVRAGAVSNISVDSCWFDNPLHRSGQTEMLSVTINNRSGQDIGNLPVRLTINDSLRNETSIILPASSVTEIKLPFTVTGTGWQQGRVSISDYPYEFDNELFFTYRIETGISVLLLYEDSPNPYFHRLFLNDPYFRSDEYSYKGFPRSDFKGYHAVILAGIHSIDNQLADRIKNYVSQGGTVWFFPEPTGQLINYNEFLSSLQLPSIQTQVSYTIESALGRNQEEWLKTVVVNADKKIRMPVFHQSLRFQKTGAIRSEFLTSLGGEMILWQFPIGKGSFVLSSFPLEEQATDLMFHPLFIPMTFRITSTGITNEYLYLSLYNNKPIEVFQALQPDAGAVSIKNSSTGFITMPVVKPGTGGESMIYPTGIPLPGFYELNQDNLVLRLLAFNNDRRESDLSYVTDSLIISRFKNAGWTVSVKSPDLPKTDGTKPAIDQRIGNLWHFFLITVIVLLLAESLVMNRKK